MRYRTAITTAALLALLPLTACSDDSGGSGDKGAPHTEPGTSAPADPSADTSKGKGLPLGKAAPTIGAGGTGSLEITPTAVTYTPTASQGMLKPANGRYAVIAYKARSVTAVAADETAPADSGGWTWTAPDGQSVTTLDGEATSVTPAGYTNSGPVQPGAYQWRSVAFDLTPAQAKGGQLVYTDGEQKTHTWTIPATDSGPEADKLKKAVLG
ncbi:hypothetical protein ACMA1D_01980 [Streptomyces sp. 796.1]|uniref:hypothetical protein n=1 Tax=Streptomyces sp. 796.1 TaxID=3163029 RepID=UPI0039C8CDF9